MKTLTFESKCHRDPSFWSWKHFLLQICPHFPVTPAKSKPNSRKKLGLTQGFCSNSIFWQFSLKVFADFRLKNKPGLGPIETKTKCIAEQI